MGFGSPGGRVWPAEVFTESIINKVNYSAETRRYSRPGQRRMRLLGDLKINPMRPFPVLPRPPHNVNSGEQKMPRKQLNSRYLCLNCRAQNHGFCIRDGCDCVCKELRHATDDIWFRSPNSAALGGLRTEVKLAHK
jgi:hypothetical protein